MRLSISTGASIDSGGGMSLQESSESRFNDPNGQSAGQGPINLYETLEACSKRQLSINLGLEVTIQTPIEFISGSARPCVLHPVF